MNGTAVRLKYATLQNYAVSGMTYSWLYIIVKVKNIAYRKNVWLHYNHLVTGWSGISLNWDANYGDYDIFSLPNAPTGEFVVGYDVAGKVYWDNNDGANYRLNTFSGRVGGNVMLKKLAYASAFYNGEIYVNNLSYHKRVGVRYSSDNRVTWTDLDATYFQEAREGSAINSTMNTVEIWNFSLATSLPQSTEFALYYQNLESGQWYWDNNFGQNYRLRIGHLE